MSTTPRRASRSKASILAVATALFSETGYAGTTMRDIAKAVGVLPGSLYTHVDGKEKLLVEIVESGIDRFLAGVAALGEHEDAAGRLRAAVRAHVEAVAENPQRTLVVFHQWRYLSGANRDRIVAKRQQYEDVFTRIVDEGVATGAFSPQLDERIAVLSILGSLNWTVEWFRPGGAALPAEVADRLADAVLCGLVRG